MFLLLLFGLSACNNGQKDNTQTNAGKETTGVTGDSPEADSKIEKLYYTSGKLKYAGQVSNGLQHGKGKVYYESGALKNQGEWVNGLAEGKMRIYTEDGNLYYEGEVKNDNLNGIGKLYQNSMLYYVGRFQDNKFHGTGEIYDTSNGALIYEGNFENNTLIYGKSFKTNKNGDETMYEGGFMERKSIDGAAAWISDEQGKYYVNGALWYDGAFSDGLFSGKGKLFRADGTIAYSGNFVDGKMQYIHGRYYDSQGITYAYDNTSDEGVSELNDLLDALGSGGAGQK